ncbi:hypothetical protein AVEN_12197-1, partial [Araneus ventricosus]
MSPVNVNIHIIMSPGNVNIHIVMSPENVNIHIVMSPVNVNIHIWYVSTFTGESRHSPISVFHNKALMSSLKQMLGDGVVAVAGFVCLIIKILLDHPEEQEKVHEEIVDVVGTDRQPTVEDKSKLTYTNAFILEALRTSDFFAYSPSLECT